MAITVYTEQQNDIIHNTSVDFVLRPVSKEITIVQYDKSLPIIKVDIYLNGIGYELSDDDTIFVRVGKPDHTFVYDAILGVTPDKKSVYFRISEQMATVSGKINCVLELNRSAGMNNNIPVYDISQSSPIPIIVDPNPIKDGDVESSSDVNVIRQLVEQAQEAANTAVEAESEVEECITNFQENIMTENEAYAILTEGDE